MEKELQELLQFIKDAPSPFHTVETAGKMLQNAGFVQLDMTTKWELAPGGRYFVTVYDSSLLAFALGEKPGPLRLAAAHTDFPCFRIKPHASINKEEHGLLNVEKYGGLILRTWLDRPLGLAGKVVLRSEDVFKPDTQLVNFDRPLLTIPSLAIHMDREVNKEGKLNPQTDMLPLAVMENEEFSESFFTDWLSEELEKEDPEDILAYELSAYPFEEGCLCGLYKSFISSPRLDNLTSVLACLKGIMAAEPKEMSGLRLIALFDNEEIGSGTKQGAGSTVLNQVLERIYSSLGQKREDLWADIASGFMLSVDVAHALHPSHAGKHDPSNQPLMGGGIVLKQAATQTYAGDAEAIAIIRGLCESHEIPCQSFVNRSDVRGGSTLGSIASTLVPIRTMDIGVPMLAMHSAREVMHKDDQLALNKLLITFMSN